MICNYSLGPEYRFPACSSLGHTFLAPQSLVYRMQSMKEHVEAMQPPMRAVPQYRLVRHHATMILPCNLLNVSLYCSSRRFLHEHDAKSP